jgi:NADP-dependent 3-hydroxy acid dehydrogenase YdfG
MKTLEGRVGVVTGAASGIGKAMAKVLAAEGVKVVLADVEEGALKVATDELAGTGADVLAHVTDVADAASVQALADATVAHFGAAHIVCNNAGVSGLVQQSWTAPSEDWQWVFGVNVWGIVHGIQAFLPILLQQEEGHVINTGSAACFEALPGMAAYGASKHAVLGISEALYREMRSINAPIGVSVLVPAGTVNTNIMRSERNWPSSLGVAPTVDRDPVSQAVHTGFTHMFANGNDPSVTVAPIPDAIRNDQFMISDDPAECANWGTHPTKLAAGENPSWPPT